MSDGPSGPKAGGPSRPENAGSSGKKSKGTSRPKAEGSSRAKEDHLYDVLVVGGGPAGSSCAYWLADAGWDVAVVEKKRFPREKTCGDGLTPRAVRQLADMGIEKVLADSHKYRGLRAHGFGQVLELPWPEHPAFPSYGYTVTRHDLDGLVAGRAADAGASVLQGTEAVEPLAPEGDTASALKGCRGARVSSNGEGIHELRARYVVVADGANSRFGRALGTRRERAYPMGMALRGYYRSPRNCDPFIESHLDIREADGTVVPGYGWIFPLGDGRVNVGVGVLSSEPRWRGANTTKLMDTFVAGAPESWGISPETACGPPTGGRLPMGLSVGPRSGPNTLIAGDAGGLINPFNGEGIAYGYETGRLAAAALGAALNGEGRGALVTYERRLLDAYGAYYKVARAFVHLISNPKTMRVCVGLGLRSEQLMEVLLRIMANLLRPDELGVAELAYQAMEAVSHAWPERPEGLV